MIEVQGLSHTFAGARGRFTALQGIDLTVEAGSFIALVGPSGSGKTTLLNVIAGLEPHRGRGTVTVEGQPPRIDAAHISYMLSRDCLLPWRRALANAALGLEVQGRPRREREKLATEALAAVGLGDFGHAYPAELSQGMRQRVALARVFATSPRILLLDEPFSALDPQTRITVQDAFLRLWQQNRSTVVLVTHDLSEAISMADRVFVMTRRPGRIKAVHDVSLPRPRSAMDLRSDPRFHETYERVWADLRDEVAAAEADSVLTGARKGA
ncbi:MAG TPA: ABC transporter ATP-binding protein [Trebonia sp.]